MRIGVCGYDPQTRTLRLCDGKGKRSEPHEHRLPLGPEAAKLVKTLIDRARHLANSQAQALGQPVEPNPSLFLSNGTVRVFPTTPGKRIAEISAIMQGETFNLRDIRRTAETMLASLNVSRDVRAQLLCHGLNAVQHQHYDRYSYIKEKQDALMTWEAHLHRLEAAATAESDNPP